MNEPLDLLRNNVLDLVSNGLPLGPAVESRRLIPVIFPYTHRLIEQTILRMRSWTEKSPVQLCAEQGFLLKSVLCAAAVRLREQ